MHTRLRLALLLTAASFAPAPVFAQSYEPQAQARIDRLERDIQLLQRQLARGEPVTAGNVETVGGPAQLEVRLSAMEEQMRSLQGRVEEAQFQSRKVSEQMDKLQRDVDFRFNELQQGGGAAAGTIAPIPAAPGSTPAASPVSRTDDTPAIAPTPDQPAGATSGGDGVLRAPESTSSGSGSTSNFSTPREHYNYAFRLLNQTQYEEAASTFESFVKTYPKDPLVGNAYYWEGETYYIRRDFVNAADNFRKGFEALPDGPKAADNLLKLAMSLNALDRDKEACTVLSQILTKFRKSSTSITEKADQERKRIGCK